MRLRSSFLVAGLVGVASCGGGDEPTAPPPPPAVQLKDVVIQNLPSPYYHFAYDAAGRVATVSFASGFTMYDVQYDGGRIREMQNDIIVNHDRLVYFYDDAGRVTAINEVDDAGVVFTRLDFSYAGQRLIGLERAKRVTGGFVIDKTMSMTYHPDGNLLELTDHRPAIAGLQPEATTVVRFEDYDNGTNVDGFGLLHNDFFDHLVLLPGVVLQKSNPRREIHTGDGDHLTAEFTYTYDGDNRPLVKSGIATILDGPNAGRQIPLRTEFSYY